MFQFCYLFRREVVAQFLVACLLQVGKESFLSLPTLIHSVLFWVHCQFKEFFVVLTAVPIVVCHLLAEGVEGIGHKRARIFIGKLTSLLLCQFMEYWVYIAWHLSTLAKNHAPHGIVHHHKASLALCNGKQIHKSNVLNILRERCDQWRITNTRPNVCHFVE